MRLVRFVAIAGLLFSLLCGTCFSADVTGRAFTGGATGTMFYLADDQMNGSKIRAGGSTLIKSGVKPRPYGDISFGYVFKPYLSALVTVGYGWEAYNFDRMRVATATPVTAGIECRYGTRKYVPKAGIGAGYYVWSVLEDRRVMKDRITREELKRGDPGGYVMVGLDYFVRPDVAITWDAVGHYIFSKDTEAFPSGYAYDKNLLAIKLGLRYYFAPQKKGS
jgi:hypothetical protein